MTRWLVVAGLVLGAGVLAADAAVAAGMASIVTVSPVDEQGTEEELKAAAASALGRALRGAQAMGLADVMLKSIRLVPGTGVVVEIVASDSDAEGDSELEPTRLEPGGPVKREL